MTPLEYRELGMLQGGIVISQVTYSQGFIGDAVQPINDGITTLQPQLQVVNAFDNLLSSK
ncbi:MAG: hypothetical protein HC903_18895 [Methylacidiphilales bacterium]|nr:hypothetical protein [Candidatus Methylacidiphilales bacterium]